MSADESAAAVALGRLLQLRRQQVGLTQAVVARAAMISVRHLRRLEYGRCRTRRSTLARFARALSPAPSHPEAARPTAAHPDVVALYLELVDAAGVALAAESAFAERVARRRNRRAAVAASQVRRLAVEEVVGGVVERLARVWVDGDGQVQRRVVYALRTWDGRCEVLDDEQVPADLFGAFPLPRSWRAATHRR